MNKFKDHIFKGEEKIITLGWILLFLLASVACGILCVNTKNFIAKLRNLNPDYPFPSFKDLSSCLIILTIIMPLKVIIESAFVHVSDKIMDKKFLKPDQAEMKKIIRRKLAANVYKILYYGFVSVFGYFVLRDIEYCPKSLGGKGYMSKMFESGYPDSYYHEKPGYFNLHYFICITNSLVDWIWLVFIYDRQSDFWNMLLHHLCTSSLLIFSYVTNYSHIGSIVLYSHNICDFIVYVNRLIVYCHIPFNKIKKVFPITLLFGFFHTRLFILGQAIYTIYYYITWEWEYVTLSLWIFLFFLYFMHANWTIMLLKRFFNFIIYDSREDSFSFKKKPKTDDSDANVTKPKKKEE